MQSAELSISYPLKQFYFGKFQFVTSLGGGIGGSIEYDNPTIPVLESKLYSYTAGAGLDFSLGYLFSGHGNRYDAEGVFLNVAGPNVEESNKWVMITRREGDDPQRKGGDAVREKNLFGGVDLSLRKGLFGGYASLKGAYSKPKDSYGNEMNAKSLGVTYEHTLYKGLLLSTGYTGQWLQAQNVDQTYRGTYSVSIQQGPFGISGMYSPELQSYSTRAGLRFGLP